MVLGPSSSHGIPIAKVFSVVGTPEPNRNRLLGVLLGSRKELGFVVL